MLGALQLVVQNVELYRIQCTRTCNDLISSNAGQLSGIGATTTISTAEPAYRVFGPLTYALVVYNMTTRAACKHRHSNSRLQMHRDWLLLCSGLHYQSGCEAVKVGMMTARLNVATLTS